MNDSKMKPETIFVSIASYRDADCQHTIKDMFEKAAHPERIIAGVLWQIDEEKDQHCFQVPYLYPEQVKEIKVNYLDTGGVGWARAETLKMHAGEDFILQIDAHSRFHPRWDDLLIDHFKALQANGSKKPVITQWAPEIPEQGEPQWTNVNVLSAFIEKDCFRAYPRMALPIRKPAQMTFLSAHCLFSTAEFYQSVPNDPAVIFTMEEFSTMLRAWTHGWDVYTLPKSVIAHRYKTNCKPEDKSTLWQDKPELGGNLVMDTRRYRHLIGKEVSDDPDAVKELDKYGLGSERSLKSFEQFSGVNLTRNSTEIFTDMGLAGKERILPAGCGPWPAPDGPHTGPQPAAVSAAAKHRLLNLLQDTGITTILDIGCMLHELMSDYTGLQTYTGLHTDEALLNRLAAVHEQDPRFCFFKYFANITVLPRTDAVVLDVGRLSEDDCWYLFDLIKKCGAGYLLAPYQPDKNDLTEAPFRFMEPEQILKCGRRLLGIWPVGGPRRRFFYKEPQLIRKLRTPLIAQLEQDLILIQKTVMSEKDFRLFLRQWSKSWQQNNDEFKSSGLERYFIDHNILEKRHMFFRLLYICEYDRFLPEYRPFVTHDPYIRHIQSYLTCEALYDFAARHGIGLKFGAKKDDKYNYPLGNPPIDADLQLRAKALSDAGSGPKDNTSPGKEPQNASNFSQNDIDTSVVTGDSKAQSMVGVVYHCYLTGKWETIVKEQLNRVQASGLYARADIFWVTVNLNTFSENEFKDAVKDYPKLQIEFHQDNLFEYPGIKKVKELGDAYDDIKILYFHTKGVANTLVKHDDNKTSAEKIANIGDWRECLEYFVIDKWEESLEHLKTHDNVGVACGGAYFGNFWWSQSRHIRKLSRVEPSNNRWSFENWLNTGRDSTNYEYFKFSEFGIWPYMSSFPQEWYKTPEILKKSKIEITKAEYGAPDFEPYKERPGKALGVKTEVTEILKDHLRNNNNDFINFHITNGNLGGDPAPGTEKFLFLKIKLNRGPDKIYEIAYPENRVIKLDFR